MRDIREVSYDNQDIVRQMIDEFFQKLDETKKPKPDMIEKLVEHWIQGDILILGKFYDDLLIGIAFLGLVSNILSIIHIRSDSKDFDSEQTLAHERELFNEGFHRLKLLKPWVTIHPLWMNSNLIEHALEVGFKRFDKIGMSADRETLDSVPVPQTPSGYRLEQYNDLWKDTIAGLVYESFRDSDSARAEPQFLYSPELCLAGITDIVSDKFGDFKNGSYSWVVKHGSEIIGVTLRTLVDETTGLGAEMCLNPTYRGKGLGKLLFIHSIRYLLEHEPNVKKMELYVIDTNPARHLYASVGFKETSRYQMYTWLKGEES
jgi:GNAT superfamily N-acetyltransferase